MGRFLWAFSHWVLIPTPHHGVMGGPPAAAYVESLPRMGFWPAGRVLPQVAGLCAHDGARRVLHLALACLCALDGAPISSEYELGLVREGGMARLRVSVAAGATLMPLLTITCSSHG